MPSDRSRRRYRRRTIGIRTSAQQPTTVAAHDQTAPGTYWYDLRTRDPFAATMKRLIDQLTALSLLTILAPLILLIIALIRFNSPGPPCVVLRRVGFRCNTFGMYAFRTTYSESDDPDDEPAAADSELGAGHRRNPRMTPVGRTLRRCRLDQIPQLVNVLEGTMSFVGPRPLLVRDLDVLTSPSRMRRFTVLPGMTGLPQVSGGTRPSRDEQLQLDRTYVNEWCLWLDLKILLRSIADLLTGRGASRGA